MDTADVLSHRAEVFKDAEAPSPGIEVAINLNEEDADMCTLLRERGFVADEPTLWVAEGVFMYMELESAVSTLLARMAEMSAPGSVLIGDSLSTAFVATSTEGDGCATRRLHLHS